MQITLENISVSFGSASILRNINYSFENGIYLISGRSGVGKTTLLNLIKGYIKPDNGHIYKKDAQIAYLMQETLLFNNLTVRENILLKSAPNYQSAESIDNVLEYMRDIGLPVEFIDKKVSMLSGGQKRRLELALLSLEKSDVILLDEPVANLDPESIEKVALYIEKVLSPHRTIIISSHIYMNFQRKVERLILEGGNLFNADIAVKTENL